jgi:hypothetical protein
VQSARNDEDRHSGWIGFAGVLMIILGTLNTIEGIAAVSNSKFFVHHTHYVAGQLRAWGWISIFIGIALILVGLGIFAKNQFARWAGVGVLGLNAIGQLLMIPAYPLLSLAIFAVDILAIYGLVMYGDRVTKTAYSA